MTQSYLGADDQELYDGKNRKIFHLKTMEKGMKQELSIFYGTDDSSKWQGTGHLVVRQQ